MYAVEAKDGYKAFLSVSDSWRFLLHLGKSNGPGTTTSSLGNPPEKWSAVQAKDLDRVLMLDVEDNALQTLARHDRMTLGDYRRRTTKAMFETKPDVISAAAAGNGQAKYLWGDDRCHAARVACCGYQAESRRVLY